MDWVWVLIGCLLFVFGLMIFLGGRPSQSDLDVVVAHKNGLPLTPRHARQIVRPVEPSVQQDALSQLASVVNLPPQEKQSAQSDLSHGALVQDTLTKQDSLIKEAPAASLVIQSERPQENHSPKAALTTDTDDSTWQQKPVHAYFEDKKPTGIRNHDALYDYKKAMTIMLTPKSLVLEGRTVLDLARQYALRFGDFNMFHRYENPKGEGMLWFSVLGMTKDGLVSFDLAALPYTHYRGLAFFVALPNPQALRGFDSMVQVAQSIAQSVDADIHTEDGYLLNEHELKKMRHVVASY